MLAELAALAAAGGAALVSAAATDAWKVVRAGFAQLLGRGDAEHSSRIEERLEQTRSDLEAAGPRIEQVRLVQQAAWTARLEDLLAEQPQAAEELRTLVKQVNAAKVCSARNVSQHVVGLGQAQQTVQGYGAQTNIFGAIPSVERTDD